MKKTILAFTLCLAACGGKRYATQVIRSDCGPADGPAFLVVLAESVTLECRTDGLAPTVAIYTVGSVTPPQTITLVDDGSSDSWAAYCPGGGAPCTNTRTGELHFDTFENGQGGSGTWRLMVGDTEESGVFDATWCEPVTPVLCG